MSRLIVFGATGSLGRHVVQQAVAAGHAVSVVVRTPSKLSADLRGRLTVHEADVAALTVEQLGALVGGHAALIDTAGYVGDGQQFVNLFAHIVAGLETLPEAQRPVSWFLAGLAALDISEKGRMGVELPQLRQIYWPHRANFDRLRSAALDWRLLCPGPMVEAPAVGLAGLRVSLDRLPVEVPAVPGRLPDSLLLHLISAHMPEMVVPYADAAALMLANLQPGGDLSRHRVGLALSVGISVREAH